MKALYCDGLIDGVGGGTETPSVILVDGDQIVDVLPQSEYSGDASEVIRLDGQTAMPGLFDLHVHLKGLPAQDWRIQAFDSEGLRAARATHDLRLLLEAGFTTVRDCGSTVSISLRNAVDEGSIPGPRIIAAGRFIEQTGGVDDASIFLPLDLARRGMGPSAPRLADGPYEVRRAVREQVREGADFIKTCADGQAFGTSTQRRGTLEWTTEELDSLVDEAHRLGRKVAVHALWSDAAIQAVQCGADTIEHGWFLDERGLEEMARAGAYLVPTMASVEIMAKRGPDHGMSAWLTSQAGKAIESTRRVVRDAHKAGVPLATGSDCSGIQVYPFGDNVVEIQAMIQAGVPAMDALVASTSNAATACGLDKVGALTAGYRADIIAVPRDPLRDPTAFREVSFVMKAGDVIAPSLARSRASTTAQAPPWLI